jgi:hypothetical protein
MPEANPLRCVVQIPLRDARGCGGDHAPALAHEFTGQPEHGTRLTTRAHKGDNISLPDFQRLCQIHGFCPGGNT